MQKKLKIFNAQLNTMAYDSDTLEILTMFFQRLFSNELKFCSYGTETFHAYLYVNSMSRHGRCDSSVMKIWIPKWDIREMYSSVSRSCLPTCVCNHIQPSGIQNEKEVSTGSNNVRLKGKHVWWGIKVLGFQRCYMKSLCVRINISDATPDRETERQREMSLGQWYHFYFMQTLWV